MARTVKTSPEFRDTLKERDVNIRDAHGRRSWPKALRHASKKGGRRRVSMMLIDAQHRGVEVDIAPRYVNTFGMPAIRTVA